MRCPIFARGTVAVLSTATCEACRNPSLQLGRIMIRNRGQSCRSLVSGSTVADASAWNASACTTRAGRDLRQSPGKAIATRSPRLTSIRRQAPRSWHRASAASRPRRRPDRGRQRRLQDCVGLDSNARRRRRSTRSWTSSRSNAPIGLCSSPAILVNAVFSAGSMRKVRVSTLADDVVRGMPAHLVMRIVMHYAIQTAAACNRCLPPL